MRVESRTDRKKKLYKLIVAFRDMVDARHACALFGKTVAAVGDDLYYPLLNSIVVSYSKPFVDNHALGPLSAHWRKFRNPEFQKTHERLLKFRHENIEHNDLKTVQVEIIPPGVKTGGRPNRAPDASYAVSRHVFAPQTFQLIWDTIEDIRVRLMKAIDEEMLILYGQSRLPNKPFPLTFDDEL